MQRFFDLLFKYRVFLLFFGLEITSFYFIFKFNSYQSSYFFSTSSYYIAQTIQVNQSIEEYFNLKKINKNLSSENAYLRSLLAIKQAKVQADYQIKDSIRAKSFEFMTAKLVNNSTSRSNNYITINKGKLDGVKPGMGLISTQGVVGKIRNVSDHYSVAYSLLHTMVLVSSKIKKQNAFCTTQWDGFLPSQANLLYLPRHIKVKVGDSVVTTGFNTIYPEGVMIGRVKSIDIKPDETFYKIKLTLSSDFSALSYVYVVKNLEQPEVDSLQNLSLTEKKP